MGTRADFYVGRGKDAEWIGSIAWDGYPDGVFDADGIPPPLPSSEQEWRQRVTEFVAKRDDGTLPARGWPWPWENSALTDEVYAFDAGRVWFACGRPERWHALDMDAEYFGAPGDDDEETGELAVFPDMSTAKAAPAGSDRSGVMVFGFR